MDSFHQNIIPQQILAPGIRFVPYDSELIDYLTKKINDEPIPYNPIVDANVYKHNPQELAESYPSLGKDEWYFFTPRDKKYPNGSRPNRAAGDGYWKATAADKPIYLNNNRIGSKRSLVFFQGKSPNGKKTNWLMNEYMSTANDMKLDNCVLCRIYKNSSHWSKKEKQDTSAPKSHENEGQPVLQAKVDPMQHVNHQTIQPNLPMQQNDQQINLPENHNLGGQLDCYHTSTTSAEPNQPPTYNDDQQGSPYMTVGQLLGCNLENAELVYDLDEHELWVGLDLDDTVGNQLDAPSFHQEFHDFAASFFSSTNNSDPSLEQGSPYLR